MKQLFSKTKGHDGADKESFIALRPGGLLTSDAQGGLCFDGSQTMERFDLVPAAAVATGTSKLLVTVGTGTEVVAKADKGGVNIKTQATTPAQGDNALLAAVATTNFQGKIRAASQMRCSWLMNLTSLSTLFASFGLSENISDADPSGTAGEGVMFLFVPSGNAADLAVNPGLAAADYANWIIAEKVNGADVYTKTAVPVVAAQDYELVVEIGEDLKAKYYIDGVLVHTGAALTSGDTLNVFGGLEKRDVGGTERDFDVRYVSLSRLFG